MNILKTSFIAVSNVGYSDGPVNINDLLANRLELKPKLYETPLEKIAEYISVGG